VKPHGIPWKDFALALFDTFGTLRNTSLRNTSSFEVSINNLVCKVKGVCVSHLLTMQQNPPLLPPTSPPFKADSGILALGSDLPVSRAWVNDHDITKIFEENLKKGGDPTAIPTAIPTRRRGPGGFGGGLGGGGGDVRGGGGGALKTWTSGNGVEMSRGASVLVFMGKTKSEESLLQQLRDLEVRDLDSTRHLNTGTRACTAAARASHVSPDSESGEDPEESHWAQPGLDFFCGDDAAPLSRRALDIDRAKDKEMQDRVFKARREWRNLKSAAGRKIDFSLRRIASIFHSIRRARTA
jgi:hypothetical protein